MSNTGYDHSLRDINNNNRNNSPNVAKITSINDIEHVVPDFSTPSEYHREDFIVLPFKRRPYYRNPVEFIQKPVANKMGETSSPSDDDTRPSSSASTEGDDGKLNSKQTFTNKLDKSSRNSSGSDTDEQIASESEQETIASPIIYQQMHSDSNDSDVFESDDQEVSQSKIQSHKKRSSSELSEKEQRISRKHKKKLKKAKKKKKHSKKSSKSCAKKRSEYKKNKTKNKHSKKKRQVETESESSSEEETVQVVAKRKSILSKSISGTGEEDDFDGVCFVDFTKPETGFPYSVTPSSPSTKKQYNKKSASLDQSTSSLSEEQRKKLLEKQDRELAASLMAQEYREKRGAPRSVTRETNRKLHQTLCENEEKRLIKTLLQTEKQTPKSKAKKLSKSTSKVPSKSSTTVKKRKKVVSLPSPTLSSDSSLSSDEETIVNKKVKSKKAASPKAKQVKKRRDSKSSLRTPTTIDDCTRIIDYHFRPEMKQPKGYSFTISFENLAEDTLNKRLEDVAQVSSDLFKWHKEAKQEGEPSSKALRELSPVLAVFTQEKYVSTQGRLILRVHVNFFCFCVQLSLKQLTSRIIFFCINMFLLPVCFNFEFYQVFF